MKLTLVVIMTFGLLSWAAPVDRSGTSTLQHELIYIYIYI